jgi:multimeric flavodoxin WrbA
MKTIACILGSPRVNGNTETLARKFVETAESLGAQAEFFALNKLTYKGCQGCKLCKTKFDECVVKDDLTAVLRAAAAADIVVIASPVYFGQLTSQMKGVLERMYSFLKPTYLTEPNASRLSPNAKCVFVFSQGSPDPSTFDIFAEYDRWFGFLGFKNYLIRGVGLNDRTDAAQREDLLKQAEKLAVEMMKMP